MILEIGGIYMSKRFALIVRYECGQCVYLTDTMDLDKALAEFREVQRKKCEGSLMFKDFHLPIITSAEIMLVYK